jgi:hypothetical protein
MQKRRKCVYASRRKGKRVVLTVALITAYGSLKNLLKSNLLPSYIAIVTTFISTKPKPPAADGETVLQFKHF